MRPDVSQKHRSVAPVQPHTVGTHAAEQVRDSPPLQKQAGRRQLLRAVAVAAVLVLGVVNPALAMRWGGVICGVFALGAFTRGWRTSSLDVAVLALGLLPLASTAWTVDPAATALSLQNYLGCAAIFLAVRVSTESLRDTRVIAYGFVAGCTIGAAQLIQASNGLRYNFDRSAERYSLDAAVGASANYLAYSFVAGLAVMVLLWRTRRSTPRAVIGYLAFVALMWLGIVQTGTRGALVGLISVGVWLAAWRIAPRFFFWVLSGVFIGLNSMILLGIRDDRLTFLAGPSFRDTGTLNGRLEVWPLARASIDENPFLGIGAGAFATTNPLGFAAHNAFLDLATGMGMGAVLLFGFILYWAIWRGARSTSTERLLLAGATVAAIAPALSTGFWIEAPALWGILALTTRFGIDGEPADAIAPTSPPR